MRYGQYCLDFRGKKHAPAVIQQVERFDADAITNQVHRVFTRVVNRNGKHAVELADKADAFTLIQTQNYFSVRPAIELHTLLAQLGGQFDVVEDFTVLHNSNLAVATYKGLMAAANVDDGQAPVANCHAALRLAPGAVVVRPTVDELFSHRGQQRIVQRLFCPVPVSKNATHISCFPCP